MYEVCFDELLLPVAPSKIDTKIKNFNKTMRLVNGQEINFLKSPGLKEIEMDLLLPNSKYPFAKYKNGFKKAGYFLEKIESLKSDKEPFELSIFRKYGTNDSLHDTYMTVSLEEYKIIEDSKNGSDIIVKVKLKEYIKFETKTIRIIEGESVIKSNAKRETKRSPEPKKKPVKHTVKQGDTLWKIAKKYYGNGKLYPEIYQVNKDKIKNPNKIYIGQILTIPVL